MQSILPGDYLNKEHLAELKPTKKPLASEEEVIDPSIEDQLDLLAEIIVSRLLRELSNDANE